MGNQASGRPASSCRTFARSLFMRVPLPAARTIALRVYDRGLVFVLIAGSRGEPSTRLEELAR